MLGFYFAVPVPLLKLVSKGKLRRNMNELDQNAAKSRNFFVHESSIVSTEAVVGAGCKIWHFCHVMSGAVLGEEVMLGQNVFVDANVRVGKGCRVQNNVSLYKGVELENDVFIGPSVVFTNVLNPRAFVSRKQEMKPTLVQQGASIGANATIVCGITIGAYAMIGAGAVVTNDVPPFALVIGVPARITGKVDVEGNIVERYKVYPSS